MSDKVSSNRLVFYNTLSTIILYAITFFSAPLFSRLLGTENYGVVQVYNTWVAFFVMIVGLETKGTLAIAKVNMNDDDYKKYQSSVLFLSVCFFIVFSLILLLFHSFIEKTVGLGFDVLLIMIVHSFGMFCVYFFNAKLTYEMKAHYNLMISVVLAVSNLGLSFFLIKYLATSKLYIGRILGMSIPYTIAGILIIVYVFNEGKTFFCLKYWKFCLPLCFPLIIHGISGIICASSDRIMLQKMVGLSTVGVYSLAYNFADIMNSVWGALHNSWDPFFLEYVKNNDYDKLRKRSSNYIRLFTSLSVGFILLTPEVFYVFASPEYHEGLKIVPIVVLSIYAIFVYAFAVNYEFFLKRTDMIAIGSTIAGIVNIALNYILIPFIGYTGAAIATLLSNIVLATVHIVFAKKLVKEKWIYNLKMFLPAMVVISVAVFMFYFCLSWWVIRWMYAVIIGLIMIKGIWDNKAIF